MKESNSKILKWVALYILPLIVVIGAVLTTFFTSQASQDIVIQRNVLGVEQNSKYVDQNVTDLKAGLQLVDEKVDRIDKEVVKIRTVQSGMKDDLEEIKQLIRDGR